MQAEQTPIKFDDIEMRGGMKRGQTIVIVGGGSIGQHIHQVLDEVPELIVLHELAEERPSKKLVLHGHVGTLGEMHRHELAMALAAVKDPKPWYNEHGNKRRIYK